MQEQGYDILRAKRHGICDCGHWSADHVGGNEHCITADCGCELFAFNLEASHPERVASRDEDPALWPAYVDEYFSDRLLK